MSKLYTTDFETEEKKNLKTKALERRMKERSAINNLDAPTKKESRKLVKELSLRLQMAKEKLEDGTKNVNKMGLIQTSLASDKTVKENGVKVMAETVDEINEIQKVCSLAVAEGSGVASDFQEGKCSFTLSEKERKEVKNATNIFVPQDCLSVGNV